MAKRNIAKLQFCALVDLLLLKIFFLIFDLISVRHMMEDVTEVTEKIVPAIANALPDLSSRIERFVVNLHNTQPKIAIGLQHASVICK